MKWRLCRGTTTTQTFWAVDNTNTGGELGVSIDGGSVTAGDTLGSGTDYCGIVTATGLSAGAEYAYQLTLDGSPVTGASGTFRTLPDAGEDVDLLFYSCANDTTPGSADSCFHALVKRETADAVFVAEHNYIDLAEYSGAPASAASLSSLFSSNNPASSSSGMTSGDFEAFRNSYRSKFRYSHIQDGASSRYWRHKFGHHFKMRYMWGNHELVTSETMPGPGTNFFDGATRANWEYFFMGNPVNGDADLDTTITYDGSNVLVPYFREVIGDVEIAVLDTKGYNANSTDFTLDGAYGDAKQKAWLIDAIENTTASVFVIFCADGIPIDNAEWTGAGSILEAVGDSDRTVVILAGDTHRPYVRLITGEGARPVYEIGVSALRHISLSGGSFGSIPYEWDPIDSNSIGIVGATNANPCEITTDGPHGFSSTAPRLKISGMTGMTELNSSTVFYTPTVTAEDKLTIGVNSTSYGTYTGGGTIRQAENSPYNSVFSAAGRAACTWIIGKLCWRPNGDGDYPSAHTKIQLKNPLTGAVRWSAIVPEGARAPA